MDEHVETVIIGAGQAGLATGYELARCGQPCLILESRARVGDVWRERYDSLRLYTPAHSDALPGLRFPGPGHSFPTGRAMGDYLESYAAALDLRVRTGTGAERVRARPGGGYTVTTHDGRTITADHVVIATGGHKRPHVPGFGAALDPGIVQIHSAGYRNPAQLQDGPVLVVGAAHSGSDLALEASATHHTYLSGRVPGEVPFDPDALSGRLGLHVVPFVFKHVLTLRTPPGRRRAPEVRHGGGPLIRVKQKHLLAAGVELTGARTVGVREGLPVLEDGRVLPVTNVLWCTGYREDFGWVEPATCDADGYPRQHRGVVEDAPGLYFVGLKFQFAYASMLVLGVGRDARYVARHIATRRRTRRGVEQRPLQNAG